MKVHLNKIFSKLFEWNLKIEFNLKASEAKAIFRKLVTAVKKLMNIKLHLEFNETC